MKISTLLNESRLEKTDEAAILDIVKRAVNKGWLSSSVSFDSNYNTITLVVTQSKKPLLTEKYFRFEAEKSKMGDTTANTIADLRKTLGQGNDLSLYNPHKGHHLTQEIKDIILDIESKIGAKYNFILHTGRDYIDMNSPLAYAMRNFDKNVNIAKRLRMNIGKYIPDHCALSALYGKELITPTGEWKFEYDFQISSQNKELAKELQWGKRTRVSYLRGAEYTPEKLEQLFLLCGEEKSAWKRFFDAMKDSLKFDEEDWNGRNIINFSVETR